MDLCKKDVYPYYMKTQFYSTKHCMCDPILRLNFKHTYFFSCYDSFRKKNHHCKSATFNFALLFWPKTVPLFNKALVGETTRWHFIFRYIESHFFVFPEYARRKNRKKVKMQRESGINRYYWERSVCYLMTREWKKEKYILWKQGRL